VIAAALPVLLNVAITLRFRLTQPELIGLGSSAGLIAGFAALFLMIHTGRKAWLKESPGAGRQS
jgi:hypothetical protein